MGERRVRGGGRGKGGFPLPLSRPPAFRGPPPGELFAPLLRHPMRDERQRLVDEPVPHFDGALQSLEPELHTRRVFRSEEQTSELQSRLHLVCRLLLEKKKKNRQTRSLSKPPAHSCRKPNRH